MKIHWASVVVTAAVLAATGCNKSGKLAEKSTFQTPAGPVELKLKWPLGQRVVQDMDMKMKIESDVPGQPAPMQQNMTMGQKFAMTVLKDLPEGGHEVEMEFLSARLGMEAGGKKVLDYNSEEKTESKNPMAAVFGKIIGSKIDFYLNVSNDVDRVEGVDAMLGRLAEGGNAQAAAPIKGMFTESYFKQMMSSSRLLPHHPVAPGDSWPVLMELPMEPMGTLELNYTITLQRWEMHGTRNCARMEFQGDIKTKSGGKPVAPGMNLSIQDGTTSGISWFDPELGTVIDSDIQQDFTMIVSFPKPQRGKAPKNAKPEIMTMTNRMGQKLNIKLDSVK